MDLKERLAQHERDIIKKVEEARATVESNYSPCERCGSERIAFIGGKQSDLGDFEYKNIRHDGYLPHLDGLCSGDYIGFEVCLDCGQVQGKFPIDEEVIERWREEQEE